MCNIPVAYFGASYWYWYDSVRAGIWVIHSGPESEGELVTLFGGYSYDGVSAVICSAGSLL